MAFKAKKFLSQLLKILFSAALIFWLVNSGKLNFKALLPLLSLSAIATCLGCTGVALALATERWRRLMQAQDIHLSFWITFKLTLIGNFFNFAMPGGVGGDLVKGYYIIRNSPQARLKAAMTVLMDRLVGLFIMLLMSIFLMLAHWDLIHARPALQSVFWALLALTIAFFAGWVAVLSQRLYNTRWLHRIFGLLPARLRLLHIYEALAEYRHRKLNFLAALLLSLASQIVSVFFFVLAGQALGFHEIPLSVYFFVIPIGFMIQAIPISPAGVGVGQAALLFLFHAAVTHGAEVGPLTMTAYQVSLFAYGLLGALFYLGISQKIKNPETVSPSVGDKI
jgi:uncharacterized protein (TIRG00374 family)